MFRTTSRLVAKVPLETGDKLAWYAAYFLLGMIATQIFDEIGLVCFTPV